MDNLPKVLLGCACNHESFSPDMKVIADERFTSSKWLFNQIDKGPSVK
jgi:hypothetical protein